MSHYAYEVKEATTTINKKDFENVLSKIKKEVATDKWVHYGWRNNMLNAETLEDVASEFNIQLADEGNGNYRPVINNVYVSNFFPKLIEIVAPFMTDGELVIDNEYNIVTIAFKNGQVQS